MALRLQVVISHLHLTVDELEVFFSEHVFRVQGKKTEPQDSKSWRRVDKEAQKAGW